MKHGIYEKKDKHALHSIHSTKEAAERFLREVVPEYVKKGYYMDKTLKPDDFIVRPYK